MHVLHYGFKYLNARGPRMPEKSRTVANDITTLGCSRANYICQAGGRTANPRCPGNGGSKRYNDMIR